MTDAGKCFKCQTPLVEGESTVVKAAHEVRLGARSPATGNGIKHTSYVCPSCRVTRAVLAR